MRTVAASAKARGYSRPLAAPCREQRRGMFGRASGAPLTGPERVFVRARPVLSAGCRRGQCQHGPCQAPLRQYPRLAHGEPGHLTKSARAVGAAGRMVQQEMRSHGRYTF